MPKGNVTQRRRSSVGVEWLELDAPLALPRPADRLGTARPRAVRKEGKEREALDASTDGRMVFELTLRLLRFPLPRHAVPRQCVELDCRLDGSPHVVLEVPSLAPLEVRAGLLECV
jgi:hypothetical protein